MTKIHPYALLLGLLIGVMVFYVIKLPPFSIFVTILAIFGFDYLFKGKNRLENDKDDKS